MAIKALRRRADVQTADPNYLRHPFLVPNDEAFPRQWHYPMINLPQAWDVTTGSSNVVVAVVDSGVLLNHPDLAGQLLPGFDFISNPQSARDGDGIDPNPDDAGDLDGNGTRTVSSFHGTHVAGTVAARSNNRIGVAGVSWTSKILPIRVLGAADSLDTSMDILQGVRFAAGLPNDSGTLPTQRADIINLSLGGISFSQTEQNVYTMVRNAGVIVIAAAGNHGQKACPTCLLYPASYDGVISVSAVDINKNRAPYSTFGTRVDVAAPGGDKRVDLNGDGHDDGVMSTLGLGPGGNNVEFVYDTYEGTSMASPHMAGVAALMKAVNPSLTPQDLDTLLSGGFITEDLGVPGRDDKFGYGLIDASKAIQAAQSLVGAPTPVSPSLVVNPAALNFGLQGTNVIVSVTNAGGGVLAVGNVSQNSSGWLSVAPTNVDANGLGTYSVLVNRSGLSAGTYSALVNFPSSANTVSLPVIMQVGAGNFQANAGYHYVLLIDAVTRKALAQVDLEITNGVYNYNFTGIAPGTYQIWAGTDSDNDGSICDPGEACGGYGGLDLPSDLIVTKSLTNLDFTTGFNPVFRSQAATHDGHEDRGFARLQRKRLKEVP
jgi:serine protease